MPKRLDGALSPKTVTPRADDSRGTSSPGRGTPPRPKIDTAPEKTKPGRLLGEGKNLREVQRTDPKRAREILVATKLAGRARDVGAGVVTGAVGGVYGSGYRGGLDLDDSWACDPWGWNGWSNACSTWSPYSCGWSFAWYWSWYYPCWWWYTSPYYFNDYCSYGPVFSYYQPATTVIYSEPEVVYVERPSEPVGEAVVSASASAPPTLPVSESSLTIAAQRYLELGDRAFREGRYLDSVQFYAKAVEFAPDRGALYLVLSDALFAAGDYHYAAYAVRRALELEPELVETGIDKHGFYQDPSHFDQQLATLERYALDHREDRDARLVLGLNYLFGGRPKDAVRILTSAGSALSEDAAAQRILARARVVAQGL